ncbi:MAG: helix-turn-helix transcriptional regulator [Deltaproteobacteria bacterium]|nr:helix-turn-helix transcriptional regulator [Deltaproteobacteria bacterium]
MHKNLYYNTPMNKTKKRKTSDTQNESFGTRLARLRKDAGYSQRAFAKEAGITQRMVAYYESQGGQPQAHFLPKLADTLGVTTDELLGRDKSNGNNLKPQNRRLRKKLLELENLPVKDRETVLRVIDGLLEKQKM